MTTRVKYNDFFRGWAVEYFNSYDNVWRIHEGYYPKVDKDTIALFKTEEEAKEYDEYINRPQPSFNFSNDIPSNYYGVRGRYYGD